MTMSLIDVYFHIFVFVHYVFSCFHSKWRLPSQQDLTENSCYFLSCWYLESFSPKSPLHLSIPKPLRCSSYYGITNLFYVLYNFLSLKDFIALLRLFYVILSSQNERPYLSWETLYFPSPEKRKHIWSFALDWH